MSSMYMAKYWREYHKARKLGLPPSLARRRATWYAREWYHRMKQFREIHPDGIVSEPRTKR